MANAIRYPELHLITGLSRSTIRRKEIAGTFPLRIQLSDNAVGWLSDEVRKWLDDRHRGPLAQNDALDGGVQ